MSDEFEAAMAAAPGAEDDAAEDGTAASMSLDAFGDAMADADGAGEDDGTDKDVRELQQVWINERTAHMDLLPHRMELVQELREFMQNQEGVIEEMKTKGQTVEASCLQQDVDRIRYMCSSYLRARLFKIERWAVHLRENEELRSRAHPAELAYWERYLAIREKHFRSEVLDYLPAQYQNMDTKDDDKDVDMVERPQDDRHVFFRAQEDLENVQIGEEDATPVMEGDILCVPYNTIAGFLEGDKHGEGGAPRARGVLL